ncbi:MAG: hypothetical protein KDJ77_08550, partial [Rhodobiaceae bacterium]|nr:hypothetical protein [Rhodobiaceae bacterium]
APHFRTFSACAAPASAMTATVARSSFFMVMFGVPVSLKRNFEIAQIGYDAFLMQHWIRYGK